MWSIIAAVFGKALAMEFFHRRDQKKRLLLALDERDAKQAPEPRTVKYLVPDSRTPSTAWREGGIDGLTDAGSVRAD